ncbi:MAG: C10 family peptidase [Bacteroidetes bacterium]|nr:C10 family peptidase [Bacteroidota bacterium]MBU1116361.1 C10 family peptidase [Bacteroidota bacterium]MBU1800385.1 C10 family peptidase [Bacteroidota bacterium]
MKKKNGFLVLSLLISLFYVREVHAQLITVMKLNSNIAIDGQLEESFWDLTNQISINLGSSNNTANFGVLWDENYLYIGVNVLDGTLCKTDGNSWYSDGIEICIDGDNSKGTTLDQYDRLFAKPVKSYWIQELDERYEGIIHQWKETNDGYSMEFAIPWTNFDISPTTGVNIGLNIAVNDDDDSTTDYRSSQLVWSGNANYFNDPSTWGTLNLSNQIVSYAGDYLALLNPNGGDFCINNKTTEINWVSNGISNIDLDYSTDNGSSWNSIATHISASLESYSWSVYATPSKECLLKISDSENASVNDISESQFSISSSLSSVGPFIRDDWQVFKWPYNAYYPEDADGINGHVGNACGPTAVATVLHHWEYPIVGFGDTTFTYYYGGPTYSANFGATTYNYDNMPNGLSINSTEAEYTDAATLFYHAATAIFSKGADIYGASKSMKRFFNYNSSIAYRNDYTRAEWIELIQNDLDNGRVILMAGLTPEIVAGWHGGGGAGHFYHIDGYNENGEFHVDYNMGSNGFFDADSFPGYSTNHVILTGLEPNFNGKELSLQTHNEGEILKTSEVSEIIWNSTNVSDIRIEYTIDNGKNWEVITNSTSTSNGSYNWTTPVVSTDECKIKIIDVSDINVYDKSNDVFSIKPYELKLSSPNGGVYYVPGYSIPISWENSPISNIKIEYTTNNGDGWNVIATNVDASLRIYDWVIPNTISNQCGVKISDISNPSVFDESDDTFEIGIANDIGGPYTTDDNTILLLHFDDNLEEEASNYSLEEHGNTISFISSPVLGLVDAIYFDNSNSYQKSYITVPYSSKLSLTGNWTIELWFYIKEWDQSHNNWPELIRLPTIDWDANYFLELSSTDARLNYGFNSTNGIKKVYSSQNSITIGKWYHIALINDYDNSTLKLILHDKDCIKLEEQSSTYTAGTTISTGTEDLKIGYGLFSRSWFNGYMDEVRISNVVRVFNSAPVLSDIPDQIVSEGGSFTKINLNNFVTDLDNSDNEITWSYSGNINLSVSINSSREATITSSNAEWNGSETISFIATDPSGATASDNATFTITPVNDSPVVNNLPNQTINEGSSFTTIQLDNYVTDSDNSDSELSWSYSGTNELVVTIDNNRVASITVPNIEWNGSEIIMFVATDPSGASGSNQATFTVSNVNDGPVISNIADQTIDEGSSFATIKLDDFVTDIDNDDSDIIWTFGGNNDLSIEIDENRIATITTPNEDWFGSETISFTAKDPGSVSDSKDVKFTVNAINDPPLISDAPALIEFVSDTSFTIDILKCVSDVETVNDSLICEFRVDSDSIHYSYDDGTGILTLSAEIEFGGEGNLIWSVSDSEAIVKDTIHIAVEKAVVIGVNDEMIIPDEYVLHQNYPNPFNPSTMIKYGVPEQSNIRIEVFNMLGQRVGLLVNSEKSAGYYETTWNAANLPSGIYLISIKADGLNSKKNFTQIKKALLLK